ncbi:MAG: imidazole glycerol phosphate synthase subunit HisH [Candidatus Dormibacterales bacterium]
MIAIVDYEAGNIRSLENAFAWLGVPARLVSEPGELEVARAVVVPGVGAAGRAMGALRRRGLDGAVRAAIDRGVPYLGICLGMQLLFERSAEDGVLCLGVLQGLVRPLEGPVKVPHTGWNTVDLLGSHPVLDGLHGQAAYFVHSYVAEPLETAIVAGTTTHGRPFASAVAKDGVVGVQFHPERSGGVGLALLERFARFAGEAVAGGSPLALEARHPLS